jgi:CSLREA domain-containing protein
MRTCVNRIFIRTVIGACLATAALARADTVFTVNTLLDEVDDATGDGVCHTGSGHCSLRAAIMQANHSTAAGTVVIHVPAGTYALTRATPGGGVDDETTGDLDLTSPLAGSQAILVVGDGAARTIVDAAAIDRVFEVATGRTATLDGLTLRNGHVLFAGAGIFNAGTLTVNACVIEQSDAGTSGGGIYNDFTSTLALLGSTVRSNRAGSNGGGLYLVNTASVRNSTLEGNSADDGGGLYDNGTAVVVSSTLSGNAANTNGGGIFSRGDTFVYGSSVINNDADHDRDELGGIGGGIYADPVARLVVTNTLIVGNTILDAPIDDDCNGTLEVYGWNLLGDTQGCAFTGNGAAARGLVSAGSIGPLQDNGGPTRTHALLIGSEAIGTTSLQGCIDETGTPLATDQRGFPRVTGARCDVGAFEFGSVSASDLVFRNGFDCPMESMDGTDAVCVVRAER